MRKIKTIFQNIFLTFLFSWKLPKWPWTWGSLFSFLFLLYLLNSFNLTSLSLFVISILITIISIPIINNYEKINWTHDHSSIVIDEFVWVFLSIWIILFFTDNIYFLILWLILFRFFDIFKPWIIWIIDKKMKGGLWVMLDDIIAWFYAWALTTLIYLIISYIWIY